MSRINVAVLGSGFIVDVFVKNIKQFKNVHTRAIWGRHLDKLKQFGGFDYYTCDINDILNDDEIDVVYVALPNSLHYEYTLKCLNHKKHVILEKPFCETYKQAKHLADTAKKNNLFLYEAMMVYHNPIYIKFKTEIKNIGEIRMLELNMSQYSRRYDKFMNGIVLPAFDKSLAGGALMDLGIYNISFVTGIFGMPKSLKYYPNIKKGIDTSGVLIMDYGYFKASLINSKDCQGNNNITIQGDKGYLYANCAASRCSQLNVFINNKKPKTYGKEGSEFSAWKNVYADFIKIYKNKDYKTCYEYLNQTLLAQKVLEKAVLSAKKNV